MTDCKKTATLLDPGLRVSKEDIPITEEERRLNVPYRELIGSLMVLVLYKRPDILFAVTKLSQYNSNLGKQHWQCTSKAHIEVFERNQGLWHCIQDWCQSKDCDILRCRLGRRFRWSVFLFGSDNVVRGQRGTMEIGQTEILVDFHKGNGIYILSKWCSRSYVVEHFLSELELIDYVSGLVQINCDNRAAIDS